MNIRVGLFYFVLTSLNWFDLGKIMMFVYIWCKQTAFFQKCQFIVASFCLFTFAGGLPIAGGNGRSVCQLPAAKEITGKMPCLMSTV